MIHLPSSILAFRNGSIGNTLVAIPALRVLKRRYPNVPLSVVVDPSGFELLEHCPWIDRLIVYDKRNNDRGILRYLLLVRLLRRLRPSHAVLFKRFFRNGLLAYLSGARIRAGFATQGHAPFLNQTLLYDDTISIVDLNLKLAASLGADSGDRRLEVFLCDDDERRAESFLSEHGITRPFWIAHYGGQTTSPAYFPLPDFRKLLEVIAPKEQPILLIGSGSCETQAAEEICRGYSGWIPSVNLPLRTMIALMKRAQAFIGFNSGPAHIAAAVQIPSVVFFQPDANTQTEIRKWSPVSGYSRVLVPPANPESPDWQDLFKSVGGAIKEVMALKTSHSGN